MLNGIRVIEIEGLGPGPFAAMLLADLGADVITIHRKGGAATPGMPDRSILDRGKRSIELDLKNTADLALARKLIAGADAQLIEEGLRGKAPADVELVDRSQVIDLGGPG